MGLVPVRWLQGNYMKQIIDAHCHMFTAGIAKTMGMDLAKVPPAMQSMGKYSIQDHTQAWLKAMDENGVQKAVFIATAKLAPDFIAFVQSSNRFVGLAKAIPTQDDAIETLKKELQWGAKGVKIYATNDSVDVGSGKAWPFYAFCQENNIPIVIHFGVTIGQKSDLCMGNPLRLSRVLKEFPKLNFIIAHFGAGFFREVLMLKYKQDNLYVDTSGTNNWLPHQDNFLTLKDIFKKTLEVFGPERVIFGTDTRIFPDGYRTHILQQQVEILDELQVSQTDKENIMAGNAKRVFNI